MPSRNQPGSGRRARDYPETPARWQITAAELRELRRALSRIGPSGDLDAALAGLASWALALLDAGTVLIALPDEPDGAALVRAAAGRGADRMLGRPIDPEGESEASVRAPIVLGGEDVGVVLARARRDRELDEADAELLRLLATQAAIAIAQGRADREITALLDRERRRADQLQVAAEFGRALAGRRRIGDVLDLAVSVLKSRFGYDQVVVYLRDDRQGDFVARATAGPGRLPDSRLDLAMPGAAAWAARSGEAQIIADRRELAPDDDGGFAAVSELAVPIGIEGAPLGVLLLASARPATFDGNDLALAQAIADELAIAVENLRLAARAREDAAAAERARLARELHDDTAQQLVAIGRRLDLLESDPDVGPLKERVAVLQDMIDDALANVRRISRNLRPTILEDLGLVAAIEALAADASRVGGPQITVNVTGTVRSLPSIAELGLYRIAQEALANSLRHADASRVTIDVSFAEAGVVIRLTDDGRGFVPPASLADTARSGGLGILGMRERADEIGARLDVESHHGRGTSVRISYNPGASP